MARSAGVSAWACSNSTWNPTRSSCRNRLVGGHPGPVAAARRAARASILLAGLTRAVAEGRRAPPSANHAVTLHAIARAPGPSNLSLGTNALAIDHFATALALSARSVIELAPRGALAFGWCAGHAFRAFRSLLAGVGSGIPVLSGRTDALGRGAGGARRTGIVASLIDQYLARRAGALILK
jgi:hypothetical protein